MLGGSSASGPPSFAAHVALPGAWHKPSLRHSSSPGQGVVESHDTVHGAIDAGA